MDKQSRSTGIDLPKDQRSAVQVANKVMVAQQVTELCGMGCIDKNGRPDKHVLRECKKFAALDFLEASEIVYNSKRCFKCLGKHMARDCQPTERMA